MLNVLNEYFGKMGKKFCTHLHNNVNALLKCGTANTYSMARALCTVNQKSFKTNEIALYRFLQQKDFQIDDKFWRCHINMLFDALEANKVIEKGKAIQINIDYTTHQEHFLILSAAILVHDKAITLYFSSRVYPVKKGMMSCKKMEEAFVKALKHLLSKRYSYILVGDKGFGNGRFVNLCRAHGFSYVFGISNHLTIEKEGVIRSLKEEESMGKFEARVVSWGINQSFTRLMNNSERWYLISNRAEIEAETLYKNRYKIEKVFQDCKSGGYELENNKIRKYDRFKRMFYLVVLGHCITSIIGYGIKKGKEGIKKNS